MRMDAPFGELGAAVAHAFGAAIANTEYVRRFLDQDEGNVPLEVVRELGEVSCFCQLAHHVPERDLLTQVLLGQLQTPTPAHRQRADTVHMFLDLAAKTADARLSEERFRTLLYSGRDRAGGVWTPDSRVHSSWRRWWLIQLRQYAVGALNDLFIDFVHWGADHGGTLRPLQLDAYDERARTLPIPAQLGMSTRTLGETSLRELVDAVSSTDLADEWPSAGALNHGLIREAAFDADSPGPSPTSGSVGALLTLVVVGQRLRAIRQHGYLRSTPEGALLSQMIYDGAQDRWSTARISEWLERQIESHISAADVLAALVRQMVVLQHLRVARGKLAQARPEDTFRFHEDSGGLLFIDHHDTTIRPISIRFDAISEALYGLGLTKARLTEEGHAPAERGWEIVSGK